MSIAAASSKFFSKAVVFAVRNSRLAHRLSRLSPQLRFRPSAMVARQSMVVTDTMGAMMKKLEVPADSACKLTDDQTKFVKEAFMLMDSEGNGEAKFKDMANFMKSMGREATDVQLTDMLTSINAQAGAHGKPKESADEGISFQAFYTLMAPIVQAGVDADAFAALSADGKSDLSVETLSAELSRLIPALPKEEANMIFKEADINQDGKITLDEFKKVMASHDLT